MHPAIKDILKFFAYEHLPLRLQAVSKPFCDLAYQIAHGGNVGEGDTKVHVGPLEGPEATVALRKLLEAKDAAVRAAVSAKKGG